MNRVTAIAALSLGFAFLVAAQTPPPSFPLEGPPEAESATSGEGGSRREVMRLSVLSRMRQRLGLSEAQTVRVMTIFEAMEKQQERHRKEMEPIQKRLRALVDDPAASDSALKEAVAAFEKQREANQRDNEAREAELLAAFTPRQQAQWLLLRRELMGRMADRMEGRPMGPRGGGPRAGGPGQRPPPAE